MKANLYITPYAEQNHARRVELETCFSNNLQALFSKIILVVENKDTGYVIHDLIPRMQDNHPSSSFQLAPARIARPSVQTYIDLANLEDEDTIHCFCNSDIFITEDNLNKIKNLDWSKKLFLALSRWDLHKGGTSTLLDRQDSADFWAFKGRCDVTNALCPLGVPGVDNSLAWKFNDAGYKVVNPSRDIITKHLHNVVGNNYRVNGTGPVIASQICPPPYGFHPPIFINQI